MSFSFEPYLCDGYPNLLQKVVSFKEVATASVKINNDRINSIFLEGWYMQRYNCKFDKKS